MLFWYFLIFQWYFVNLKCSRSLQPHLFLCVNYKCPCTYVHILYIHTMDWFSFNKQRGYIWTRYIDSVVCTWIFRCFEGKFSENTQSKTLYGWRGVGLFCWCTFIYVCVSLYIGWTKMAMCKTNICTMKNHGLYVPNKIVDVPNKTERSPFNLNTIHWNIVSRFHAQPVKFKWLLVFEMCYNWNTCLISKSNDV